MAKLDHDDLLELTRFYINRPEIATPIAVLVSILVILLNAAWFFGIVPGCVNMHSDSMLLFAVIGTVFVICGDLFLYMYTQAVEQQITEIRDELAKEIDQD